MAKYAAKGMVLEFGNTSGGASSTWTAVGQMQTIGGPAGQSTDEIDVTTHDTVGDYKEFLASFIDGGNVSVTVVYDPKLASHKLSSGVPSVLRITRDWRITLTNTPTASMIAFPGEARNWEVGSSGVSDAMTASFEVRVVGAITWP